MDNALRDSKPQQTISNHPDNYRCQNVCVYVCVCVCVLTAQPSSPGCRGTRPGASARWRWWSRGPGKRSTARKPVWHGWSWWWGCGSALSPWGPSGSGSGSTVRQPGLRHTETAGTVTVHVQHIIWNYLSWISHLFSFPPGRAQNKHQWPLAKCW